MTVDSKGNFKRKVNFVAAEIGIIIPRPLINLN